MTKPKKTPKPKKTKKALAKKTKKVLLKKVELPAAYDQASTMGGPNPLLKIEKGINRCLMNIKRDIWVIGRLLSQAKNCFLQHGQYEQWIQESFGHMLSLRSALNYRLIYEKYEHDKRIVDQVPACYLMHLVREKPDPDELAAIAKENDDGLTVDEQIEKSAAEFRARQEEAKEKKRAGKGPLVTLMRKYKEDKHIYYYVWTLRSMLQDLSYIRKIKHVYEGFASNLQNLYDAPYMPDKTRDVLQKMLDGGFLIEIDKGLESLNKTKQAFMECLDHFNNGSDGGQVDQVYHVGEPIKAIGSNPQ